MNLYLECVEQGNKSIQKPDEGKHAIDNATKALVKRHTVAFRHEMDELSHYDIVGIDGLHKGNRSDND